MEVNNILRIKQSLSFSYVGTLRNEKQFNLGDNVFFAFEGSYLCKGKIVGIELLPKENPEYEYKITIPNKVIEESFHSHDVAESHRLRTKTLKCDKVFSSLDEAYGSAMKMLEREYENRKEEINNYFKNFED